MKCWQMYVSVPSLLQVFTDNKVLIHSRYNSVESTQCRSFVLQPQLGLVDKSQSAKVIDGRLECKFSRWISVDAKEPDAGRVFTLSGNYYLLLANGPVDAKGNFLYKSI
jgi:hypothetical protein